MKRLLVGLLLLGCNQSTPAPVTSPTASATAAPPAAVESTPTPVAGALTPEAAIRQVSQWSSMGLSNGARADMLMNHLVANGRKRLLANWDAFPTGNGAYEVTFSISSITRATAPAVAAAPVAPAVKGDPFSHGGPIRPKSSGVELTWILDSTANTCIPKDERTRSLLALQPRLDESALEAVLPSTWRGRDGAPPTAAAVPIPAPPVPVMVATPSEEPPPPPPVETSAGPPELPFNFSGFVGDNKQKKAILTRGERHFSLGVGDRIGNYRVKSMTDGELLLEHGGDTVRLVPGEIWRADGTL